MASTKSKNLPRNRGFPPHRWYSSRNATWEPPSFPWHVWRTRKKVTFLTPQSADSSQIHWPISFRSTSPSYWGKPPPKAIMALAFSAPWLFLTDMSASSLMTSIDAIGFGHSPSVTSQGAGETCARRDHRHIHPLHNKVHRTHLQHYYHDTFDRKVNPAAQQDAWHYAA